MKRFLAMALVAATVFGGKANNIPKVPENPAYIQIVDSSELDAETIWNRNGKIIIERAIGTCLNENGDGKVLNPYDEEYDYISYRRVKGVKAGDVIVTYMIYNPENNAEDDIIERFDYIIEK